MRRNPLYIFQDLNSIGIFNVPLMSTIHIVNAGSGFPMFIQLVAKQTSEVPPAYSLIETSTIGDLLDHPTLYIDINASSTGISQLEAIIENGIPGWRMYGRTASYYGNIGDGALDFSEREGSGDGDGGATGINAFATGFETISEGINSFTAGYRTKAALENSFATGENTLANAKNAATFGVGTKISNASAVAIGQYNAWDNNTTSIHKTVFEIGIGTTDIERKNAFTVDLNGMVVAPEMDIEKLTNALANRTLTTKEYVDREVKLSSGYLDQITEGGNVGYRILDQDPDKYGDIGAKAVDLSSTDNAPSITRGATGDNSFAEGYRNTAAGDASHAEGSDNTADGRGSHAEGVQSNAKGTASHAEGLNSSANGEYSHAEGENTVGAGVTSHVEGRFSLAGGEVSHAEGNETEARGDISHAEGESTVAIGEASHAEGADTQAVGKYSHAGGLNTIAQNLGSYTFGYYNAHGSDDTVMEVGVGTDNNHRMNALEILGNYMGSALQGIIRAPQLTVQKIKDETTGRCLVTKEYVLNEAGASELQKISCGLTPGCSDTSDSDAAGWRILGRTYLADGSTLNPNYVRIGSNAVDFSYSNIIGGGTSGASSFAEGIDTRAQGVASHAAGLGTISLASNQFVVGQYNDNTPLTAGAPYSIFAVGNGLSGTGADAYKNAFEVHTDGFVQAPDLEIAMITSGPAKTLVTKEYVSTIGGSVSQLELVSNGVNTGWKLLNGNDNAIGWDAVDFTSHNLSAASGLGATGNNSFVANLKTKATEINTFAIGDTTHAGGITSFASGARTEALGENSFTEGFETIASNINSHAAGRGTTTDKDNQFIVGQFNAAPLDSSVFVVGTGSSSTIKRNALEVQLTGEVIARSMELADYIATTDVKTLTTKEYVDDVKLGIPVVINDLDDVDMVAVAPANNDILTFDGNDWIPQALGAATFDEFGGVAWDDGSSPSGTHTYNMDDIVAWAGKVYVCLTTTVSSLVTPDIDPTNWLLINITERGGRAWDGTIPYEVGDVTTDTSNNKLYMCHTTVDMTSLPINIPSIEPLYWQLAVPAGIEQGGILWKVGVAYIVGDITSEADMAYICNVDHTALTGDVPDGSPSQATQANWTPVNMPSSFIELTDTPLDYTTAPTKPGDVVVVRDDGFGVGNGLEFLDGTLLVSSGLQAFEDPSVIGQFGWKLIGRTIPAIGDEAVDLGYHSGMTTGAIGNYSTNFGLENTAKGAQAAAFGNANIVNGNNSVAFGTLNTVDGNQSMVIGEGLTNYIDNSVVVGRYNIDSPMPTVASIFEVGIGSGDVMTPPEYANAFEVKIDGAVIAPALDALEIEAYANGLILTTKEYVSAKILSVQREKDFDVIIADQTAFVLPGDMLALPLLSPVDVYLNGTKLRMKFDNGIDPVVNHDYYVEPDAPAAGDTTIHLTLGATVGDWVQVGYTL